LPQPQPQPQQYRTTNHTITPTNVGVARLTHQN
jgi:hypothetical protein